MTLAPLGWLGILRLGLVQTALGAIFVLLTSAINRVMVVEMALPAFIPGLLMGWHYVMQGLRPRWGYSGDGGRRRTPLIVLGMAGLAAGGVLCAVATTLLTASFWGAMALALIAFSLVGVGVGAAGTNLLALLATRVAPHRRGAAATIVWVMMIAGFAVTAPVAGRFLDPFTPLRLVMVMGVVCALAFALAWLALRGVEGGPATGDERTAKPPFSIVLAEVWREPQARLFTVFVFVSMLAYSAQDLILEPFAGIVFGLSLGATTTLAGVQHGGVLAGMVVVASVTSLARGHRLGSLRGWAVAGCVASAFALVAVAAAGFAGPSYPLRGVIFALGLSNGAFAVSAIGSMMALAAAGGEGREGTRMGVWGAAQAVAFGLGGLAGAAAADLARLALGSPVTAYAAVFIAEAVLFIVSAMLALRVGALTRGLPRVAGASPISLAGEGALSS